jgi:hypothetical protein
MRALAILALICCLSAVANHQQATAQQHQKATPNDILTSITINNDDHSKHEDQKENNVPRWWPEGITAMAVILTLFAIAYQSYYTRVAAEATQRATEHSIASERAWVIVNEVRLTAGAKDAPEGDQQVFVQCAATNHGRTPARVLGMKAVWANGPIADPGKTWDQTLYDSDGQLTPRWVMLPEKFTALHCPIPGFHSTPGTAIKGVVEPGQAGFIHGVIRYWDMFSETDRYTRFCYRWENAAPGKKEGFHYAGGDRYNQQT